VIVAEQVAAALDGGLVTNAVNMPAVAAEDLEVLGPFLPLAADLAALACELAGGSPTRLDLVYLGQLAARDTRLLTVAALNGVFQGRVEQPVNYVNAPLLARERGLEVHESSSAASPDFTSLVGATAYDAEGQGYAVVGTTIGREARRQLTKALDYEIDVELARNMLFAVNDDTPGMIGRIGTILGENGVNIANMAVSRNRREARALMALTLDSPIPDEILTRVRDEAGFVDARFIVLPEP
jgi:D-3-phosphoglycerate dehydrogenase